jgi:hypothetical protein
VVTRPPDAPQRHREQYELLRDRVLRGLAHARAQSDRPNTATGGVNALGVTKALRPGQERRCKKTSRGRWSASLSPGTRLLARDS